MEKKSQSISDLNITPMGEMQQMQIKGGTVTDDKRHPRPGSGVTTVIDPTKKK